MEYSPWRYGFVSCHYGGNVLNRQAGETAPTCLLYRKTTILSNPPDCLNRYATIARIITNNTINTAPTSVPTTAGKNTARIVLSMLNSCATAVVFT